MLETTVEVLRVPAAVLGVSGVLIAVGVRISDRRRYLSGSRPENTADAEQEDQR